MGESIAPYRLLDCFTAVVPIGNGIVFDAAAAEASGDRGIASWLRDAEGKWASLSNKDAIGAPRMTLKAQVDHMRKLTAQGQLPTIRVLYPASGTRLCAVKVVDRDCIVEHGAYWYGTQSEDEADYLTSIINSEAVALKVLDLQPVGQRDARHFDNLIWTVADTGL